MVRRKSTKSKLSHYTKKIRRKPTNKSKLSRYTKKRRGKLSISRRRRGGAVSGDLPFELFSKTMGYLEPNDQSHFGLANKKNSQNLGEMRQIQAVKTQTERANFIKALTNYLTNKEKMYIFDTVGIEKYLKNPTLDVTLTNNFGSAPKFVESTFIMTTNDESDHLESLINTVMKFLPNQAYGLVLPLVDHDANDRLQVSDGTHIYNHKKRPFVTDTENDDFGDTDESTAYDIVLINTETVDENRRKKFINKSETIILGPLVTSIRKKAFLGSLTLTSIVIPDSVTSIGDSAFQYCFNMESVRIGNSVTSIGEGSFKSCQSLTSVIIGNSVTSIGEESFYACYRLTSVIIGNSVTSIESMTFSSCYSLTSVIIPDSVTSIGSRAFDDCNSLKSIIIPNSVTSIGDGAFYECISLTSVIIPNSVTSIGNYAFSSCKSLTSVVLGNSVASIGKTAFKDCLKLKSINIPDSVTSIGHGAFLNCKSLTSVTIPSSFPSVNKGIFPMKTKIIRR
jgi:hypothetical protein